MTIHGHPPEWERPSHAEIRLAIRQLGANGFDEVRVALTGGFEPFEAQMDRRMKTRRKELRAAYKTLRQAGETKVRLNLAAADQEGLHRPRPRRRKTGRTLAGAR